jgi:hypothetical protein
MLDLGTLRVFPFLLIGGGSGHEFRRLVSPLADGINVSPATTSKAVIVLAAAGACSAKKHTFRT